MTLRVFRRSDGARLYELLQSEFPIEEGLRGSRPEEFRRIVARIYRWDARFLLGLLRLFGRPLFRQFVIEKDGRLAATGLLTFTERAGYVSTVVVDPAYRHRGYARRILEACRSAAHRAGKPYLVLEVLDGNEPARRLYATLGFRPLRELVCAVHPLGVETARAPPARGVRIRPFDRRDAPALAALARAAAPPAVLEVLPAEPGAFTVPPLVARTLGSETMAWVLEDGHRPTGFVRATVGRAMEAGHLTAPLLAPEVDEASATELVRIAIDWLAARTPARILAELPATDARALGVLTSSGFREAYRESTLYRSTDA